MNNTKGKISLFQSFLLIITAVGIINHVTVIPLLLDAAGRDSWLAVFISGALLILLIPGFNMIQKNIEKKHLLLWIIENFNKSLAYSFICPIIFILVVMIYISLNDLVSWTSITYFPNAPKLVLIGVFLLTCTLTAMTSLRTIVVMNGILLPFVVLFGFFVSFSNAQHKDYKLLMPFLENGFDPVISGVLYSITGLFEVIILFLIQHKVNEYFTYKYWVLLILILMFLTLGPLVGAIVEFGPQEAARQRFPAYEEWSLVKLGRFIEHVDFLAIYQWLTGIFIRISLLIYISAELLNLSGKKRHVFIITFSAILIIILQIPINDMDFYNLVHDILIPIIFIVLLSVVLLLIIIALVHNRRSTKLK